MHSSLATDKQYNNISSLDDTLLVHLMKKTLSAPVLFCLVVTCTQN